MRARIFLVLPLTLIILSSGIVPFSFASVESEAAEDIQAGCRDGHVMVFRSAYNDFICVEPATAERWEELGLAKILEDYVQVEKAEKPAEAFHPEFFGAPPPPPQKTTPLSPDDSECREGLTLVFRFAYGDTICTSPETASSWERLGLAEKVSAPQILLDVTEDNLETTLDPADSETNTTEHISEETPETTKEETPETTKEETPETTKEETPETTEEETFSFRLPEGILPPGLHRIEDGIWMGVDMNYTNNVIIEGTNGIAIVDTLSSYESSKKILDEFNAEKNMPVKVIIFTKITPELFESSKSFLEENEDANIIIQEKIFERFDAISDVEIPNLFTFSSKFNIDISGIPEIVLVFDEGEHSQQTIIHLLQNNKILIGDSGIGLSPYVLDFKSFQFHLE